MDCAPLAVISLDDLADAISRVTLALMILCAGVAFLVANIVNAIPALLQFLRRRGAAKPFAERAARVEQERRNSVALLSRIVARNKREAERHRLSGAT